MPTNDSIEIIKLRKLCFHCVGDDFLSEEIRKEGKRGTCDYCGKRAYSYSIEMMSGRVETAFEQHFCRTSEEPTPFQYAMLSDKESSYIWERDGQPVVHAIMNAADIPENAAEDIQAVLQDKFYDFEAATMCEEMEFSSDSYYEESMANYGSWQEEWRSFERSLKTEARFFSRSASQLLASVFDGIDTMRTGDGRDLIVEAGPGTEISSVFRARTFQSDTKLEAALTRPDIHLGSPPSTCASAGRMNAHGISVFYGSNDAVVALAEVRPPVGSKVAVARFEIIRPIRLLDLTALNKVTTYGSVFDPSFIGRLERTMFLRNLSQRITIPVMPDDEVFEHLSTQAIADFLASESTPPLDGIIFPSVQSDGKASNLVLFHKAARVEELELPKGTEISSSLGHMGDEEWEHDFAVVEEVPPQSQEPEEQQPIPFHSLPFWEKVSERPLDSRSSTLRIDVESIYVHIIEAVEFKTDDHIVRRHRWEKGTLEF